MSADAGDDLARVCCEIDGPVATVTLACPARRNAQTPRTWAAMRDFGASLPEEVRVVVVRGDGPSFSAGVDRALLTPDGLPGIPSFLDVGRWPDADALAAASSYQAGFTWLGRPDLVSIAAVHGHVVGAGFQLALACDLRVAADDVRLRMPEVTLGLVPDLGGTGALVDLVGYGRALELCATGRPVLADEAARIGLVDAVVAADDLSATVDAIVAALLAPPHAAVTEVKTLLLGARHRSAEERLAAEGRAQLRRLRALG